MDKTVPETFDDAPEYWESDEDFIARMAALSEPEYESARDVEAKSRNWRTSFLDKMVKGFRSENKAGEGLDLETWPIACPATSPIGSPGKVTNQRRSLRQHHQNVKDNIVPMDSLANWLNSDTSTLSTICRRKTYICEFDAKQRRNMGSVARHSRGWSWVLTN